MAEEGEGTRNTKQVESDSGPVEVKTDRALVNQLAEERRKRQDLENRLSSVEQSGTRLEEFKSRLASVLGDDQQSNPNDPPDAVEDPVGHARWLDQRVEKTVESTVRRATEAERQKQALESRSETNARVTDNFRSMNEWLTDANFGDFARLVNTRIAPTGPNKTLTLSDLEDAALIFRKGEILAEAASQGQRNAIQGMNSAMQNRVGTGRRANVSQGFGDMAPEEQAEVLLSSSGQEADRLLSSLPVNKQRAILQLIDPDTNEF